MNSKGTIEIRKKEGCMYMKMMQKKIRSLLYAGLGLVLCVLLCGGVGMTAQAADSKTYGDFTYEESKNGITITGYAGDETELVIPGEIAGKRVTSIGNWAFEWCRGLTSIVLPQSITNIGMGSFYYCMSLKSITLPEGLTSIGANAFSNCSGMTNITLPDSVISIGDSAFSGCRGLTSITIPDSVVNIGSGVFSVCEGLASITVSKGNKYYDSRDNCNAIIKTESNTLVCACKKTVIPEDITCI